MQQARHRLQSLVRAAAGPGLTGDLAEQVLTDAKVTDPKALRPLLTYLEGHPEALTSPAGDCPGALLRLLRALRRAGHSEKFSFPPCADCHRTTVMLLRRSPGGWLCGSCGLKAGAKECGRCGRLGPIVVRDTSGIGTCRTCYRADPANLRTCSSCGNMRQPGKRLGPNEWLCIPCSPRPDHQCSRCGTVTRAHAIDDQGPICKKCYTTPLRTCARCGEKKQIAKRLVGEEVDVCVSCYAGLINRCDLCKRVLEGVTRFRGTELLVCRNCRPRDPRSCQLCHQQGIIKANWPLGQVCTPCYDRSTRQPQPCSSCGAPHILVGRDHEGALVCGPCAGSDLDYRCTTCSYPGDIYAEGRCARCVLASRITDLLSIPGQPIAPRLQPLAEAYIRAPLPRSGLYWLRKSATSRLLGDLVRQHDAIDHDVLDALAPNSGVDFLRASLVATGILEPRAEHLARLKPWIDAALEGLPPRQLRYLKPFAEWEVLRTARRRAARAGRFTSSSAARSRAKVRAAIALLAWLESNDMDLPDLGQADVDWWIAGKPLTARNVGNFLKWTSARKITGNLFVEQPRRALPSRFLDEDDYLEQLRRCLTDDSIPVELRIAGALVRLYALPLSRIAELEKDHFLRNGDNAYLTIDKNPVILPPRLAALIDQQLTRRPTPQIEDSSPFLFPGNLPGRHRSPDPLGQRLKEVGLSNYGARNTAMTMLLAELPAVIVSDMIGISVKTANQWLGYAINTWADYIAVLMEGA